MAYKFCTIVTDASWCQATRTGGWAAWIACDGQRKLATAHMKRCPESPSQAEIWAIVNGVHVAKKRFDPEHYHIVSDCTAAMYALQNPNSKNILAKAVMDKLVGDAKVTYAHVKAHEKVKDARTYANRWCDTNAKESMRKHRAWRLINDQTEDRPDDIERPYVYLASPEEGRSTVPDPC